MNDKIKKLDQFYTNPKVTNKLVRKLFTRLSLGDFSNLVFLEPSAGSGNFIDTLHDKMGIEWLNIEAFDLEPKHDKVIQQNFLTLKKEFSKDRIVIGNPPFGKRSNLAIEFINHASKMSNTIAMILPKQFNRFLTQKQINPDLRLVTSIKVEDDAFLVEDRRYDVKTVFQIWTKDERFKNMRDKRLKKQESINHRDFVSWIHNNTKETLKYFDKEKYEWDIAIHRQGFYDYDEFITNPQQLKTNRQYLFVKTLNPDALRIIKMMDLKLLSMSNTQTPGFSKTDFVREYKKTKKASKNEVITNIASNT